MPQQLNLQDLRFVPRPLPCSARQVALGAALFLLTLGVGGQLLRLSASRDEARAQEITAQLEPMRQQIAALGRAVAPPPGASGAATPQPAPALVSLQSREQAQQRVLQLLRSGIAGQGDGHAETLAALARQANAHVWITGLHVGEDGGQVELRGNMTETARFADYLRRLNAEPRFRGRPFSQLRMSAQGGEAAAAGAQTTVSAGGAPGLTEFTLTSTQRGRISTPAAEAPAAGGTRATGASGATGAASATRATAAIAISAAPPTAAGPATAGEAMVTVASRAAANVTPTAGTAAPRPAGRDATGAMAAARRPGQRRGELQETVPAHELQRLQQQALLKRVTQQASTAPDTRRLAQAGTAEVRPGEHP